LTIEILSGSKIRSKILEILLGLHLGERHVGFPRLYILSPWISDVEIRFGDVDFASLSKNENFGHHFNIKSINLAYAILLIRIFFGVEVNIVTLPPNLPHYSHRNLKKTKLLLDFLDEIGCNVFLNAHLHTKLISSNDLALLGSCNLSNSALYDKEELAISIDDLANLDKLDEYATNVVYLSEPYGFTSIHWSGYDKIYEDSKGEYVTPAQYKFTRGWLLEKIIDRIVGRYKTIVPNIFAHCCIFVFFEEDKSFYELANSISYDLEEFYMQNIGKTLALSADPYKLHLSATTTASNIFDHFLNLSSVEWEQKVLRGRKNEMRWVNNPFNRILYLINYADALIDYKRGRAPSSESLERAMDFIRENLARESAPNIRLRIESMESK